MTGESNQYYRRPAIMEAIQWKGDNAHEMRGFLGVEHRGDGGWFDRFVVNRSPEPAEVWLPNIGWANIEVGHWVTKSPTGLAMVTNAMFESMYISHKSTPVDENSSMEEVLSRVEFSLTQTMPRQEMTLIMDSLKKELEHNKQWADQQKTPEVESDIFEETEDKPSPKPKAPRPREN